MLAYSSPISYVTAPTALDKQSIIKLFDDDKLIFRPVGESNSRRIETLLFKNYYKETLDVVTLRMLTFLEIDRSIRTWSRNWSKYIYIYTRRNWTEYSFSGNVEAYVDTKHEHSISWYRNGSSWKEIIELSELYLFIRYDTSMLLQLSRVSVNRSTGEIQRKFQI